MYNEYKLNKEQEWQEWIDTQDSSIPTEKVEKSINIIYSVAIETFDTKCVNPTLIEKSDFTISNKSIIYSVIIILVFLVIFIKLNKGPKK